MKKRRPASIFFTAALLIVLYFALFPYPLGRELMAKPAWAVTMTSSPSNNPQSPSGAKEAAPFALADHFGFVGPNGSLLHVEQRLFQVALSQGAYINYARMGTDWIMRDQRGERIASFSGNGYPVLSDDGSRILIVSQDLTALKELDRNGSVVWSRDFPAILTCLSIQGDYLLVGLLNGTLQLLNRSGTPIYQVSLGQSRISVTYGCTVAPDGSFLACVSGIQPQALTVMGRSGSSYSRTLRLTLATDYRREVRMGFSPDSHYLFYEASDAVGLVEPQRGWRMQVPLLGRLEGAAFLENSRTAAFVARDGQQVDLQLVSPFLAGISSETFSARDLYVGAVDGQLLLGVDGRLMRVDVEEL